MREILLGLRDNWLQLDERIKAVIDHVKGPISVASTKTSYFIFMLT